jgi:hypothetical protein
MFNKAIKQTLAEALQKLQAAEGIRPANSPSELQH